MTLCYEPDGVTVCRYQDRCHESRRRVQALTAPPFGPLRGNDCWAYQMNAHRAPVMQPADRADEVPPF